MKFQLSGGPGMLAPFEKETCVRTVNVKGSLLRLPPAFEIRLFDILRFSLLWLPSTEQGQRLSNEPSNNEQANAELSS
jgi:hypothetical protein